MIRISSRQESFLTAAMCMTHFWDRGNTMWESISRKEAIQWSLQTEKDP